MFSSILGIKPLNYDREIRKIKFCCSLVVPYSIHYHKYLKFICHGNVDILGKIISFMKYYKLGNRIYENYRLFFRKRFSLGNIHCFWVNARTWVKWNEFCGNIIRIMIFKYSPFTNFVSDLPSRNMNSAAFTELTSRTKSLLVFYCSWS